MVEIVKLSDAKKTLSKLVERAAKGEEFIITKSGTPMARLIPMETLPRKPGGWPGIQIAPDFDEPLPDGSGF